MSFGLHLLVWASMGANGFSSNDLKVDLATLYHPVSGIVTLDRVGTASFIGSPATIVASAETGTPPPALEWRIDSPVRQGASRSDIIEYTLTARTSDGKVGLYAKKKPGSILYSTAGRYEVSLRIPGSSATLFQREFACVPRGNAYLTPEGYQPPALASLAFDPSGSGRGTQLLLLNDAREIEAFAKGKLKYRWLSSGADFVISGTNLSATVDASWLTRMNVVGQPLPIALATHYQKLQELETGRWFGWQPTGMRPGFVSVQTELDGVPYRRFSFDLNKPWGLGFQTLTPSVHDAAKLVQQQSQPVFVGAAESVESTTRSSDLFTSAPEVAATRAEDKSKWSLSVSSLVGRGYRFWITADSPSSPQNSAVGYLPISEEEAAHIVPKTVRKEPFVFAGPNVHTYTIVARGVPWITQYGFKADDSRSFSVASARPLFYATQFDDRGIYDPAKYAALPSFGPVQAGSPGTPVGPPGSSAGVRQTPQTFVPFERARFSFERAGKFASFGYVENAFPVDCYDSTSFSPEFDPHRLGSDRLSFTMIRRDILDRTPVSQSLVGERRVRNPNLPGMGDYLLYVPTSAVGKTSPQFIVNFSTRQLRLIGKQYADATGAILVCGFSPELALFTDIFRYRDAMIAHVVETLPVTQHSVIWTGLSGGANIAGNSAIAFPYLTRGAIPIGSPAMFAAGAFSITTPVVNFHGNRDSLNGLGHSAIQIKLGKNWANMTYEGGHVWPSEAEFTGAVKKLNAMPAPRMDRSW